MGLDNLTDQHWEAASFAVYAAFRDTYNWARCGEPKEIVIFLDYHVGHQGAKGGRELDIDSALRALVLCHNQPNPLTFESIRDFSWTSPSFVRGVLSMVEHRCTPALQGEVPFA